MKHNLLLGDADDFMRDNIGMAYDAVGNMAEQLKSYGIEFEDAVQEACMALCRAYEIYDGRCKFSSLAYECMYNTLRRMRFYTRCKKRSAPLVYLDANVNDWDKEIGALLGEKTDFSSVEILEFLGELSEDERKAVALVDGGYKCYQAPMFGLRERQVKRCIEKVALRYVREMVTT